MLTGARGGSRAADLHEVSTIVPEHRHIGEAQWQQSRTLQPQENAMATRNGLDSQTRTNWLVVAAVALGAVLAGASGIYFLFFPSGGYQGGRNALYGVTLLFARSTWHDIHAWGGVLMIAAIALHFVLHWDWVKTMSKRLWIAMRSDRVRLSRGSRVNVLVDVAVASSFALTAATGIYFLFAPSGGFQGGRNPGWDPMFLFSRTTWDLIHTWSAVVLIAAAVAHLWIHWRWVVKVTRRALQPATAHAGAGETEG